MSASELSILEGKLKGILGLMEGYLRGGGLQLADRSVLDLRKVLAELSSLRAEAEDAPVKVSTVSRLELDKEASLSVSIGETTLMALDISSKVDQVYCVLEDGRVIDEAVKCSKLLGFIDSLGGKFTVAMENCSGASALCESLRKKGHRTLQFSPELCVKLNAGNKDDRNDAKAIFLTAVLREAEGRLRTGFWRNLKSLLNQQQYLEAQADAIYKRFLADYQNERLPRQGGELSRSGEPGPGSVTRHIYSFEEQLIIMLSHLRSLGPTLFKIRAEELLKSAVDMYEYRVRAICIEHTIIELLSCRPEFNRLLRVPGIGPAGAAALTILTCGSAEGFKSAKKFAAWAGFCPSHTGSGGKVVMGRMARKGDPSLKRIMYEGALSYLCSHRDDPDIIALRSTRCLKKAVICLASRMLKLAYHALKEEDFVFCEDKTRVLKKTKKYGLGKLVRPRSTDRKKLRDILNRVSWITQACPPDVSKIWDLIKEPLYAKDRYSEIQAKLIESAEKAGEKDFCNVIDQFTAGAAV